MTLQFDPSPYLAAFRLQQQQEQQTNQNYAQGMEGIGQGIGALAKIPEQQRLQRKDELSVYDPTMTDEANAARSAYLKTGQLPQSQPSQPPQSMFADPSNPSPTTSPQMASAGMPDTGWGQQSDPSSMPPMSSPTPMPQNQTESPIVAAHKQHLASRQGGGFSNLFEKKPFDVNATLSQLKGGDSSSLANLNPSQMKALEASPDYIHMKKKEGSVTVHQATALMPGLNEKKLMEAYPDGIIPQDHFALLTGGGKLEATMGTRNDQFDQKEWDKIVEKHNPDVASQRSSIGISTRLINSADRALETLNDRTRPLTYQDLGNVQQDVASIYQNGSPTDSAMKHNEYNTIYSGLAKTLQILSGKPQDAVPDEIRQQLIDRLNLLKGTSYDVINRDFDTVETGQRRIIDTRKDEWQGIRNKWKRPDSQQKGLMWQGRSLKDTPANRAWLSQQQGGQQ